MQSIRILWCVSLQGKRTFSAAWRLEWTGADFHLCSSDADWEYLVGRSLLLRFKFCDLATILGAAVIMHTRWWERETCVGHPGDYVLASSFVPFFGECKKRAWPTSISTHRASSIPIVWTVIAHAYIYPVETKIKNHVYWIDARREKHQLVPR